MKQALQKTLSFFIKADPPRKTKARKTKGQSLVELAIALPLLIMLFAGVVEFGFILNFYLSLLDSTREAARRYSVGEPFIRNVAGDRIGDATSFYQDAATFAYWYLDPLANPANVAYKGRRILIDPAVDDIIVTVYGIEGNVATQYPDTGPYHLFAASPAHFESIFDETSIKATRIANAPNEGLLVVEVHYYYHQVLALPYLTVFLANPLPLQAYTFMPIRAAEPK